MKVFVLIKHESLSFEPPDTTIMKVFFSSEEAENYQKENNLVDYESDFDSAYFEIQEHEVQE